MSFDDENKLSENLPQGTDRVIGSSIDGVIPQGGIESPNKVDSRFTGMTVVPERQQSPDTR